MHFRMGINVGDVIAEGERIYGDGVNIAARIESLAKGGEVCISRSALEQVEGKLELAVGDLGEQTLKNIAKPVRVYRVITDPDAIASANSTTTADLLDNNKPPPLPSKPSIAVLPFLDHSQDPEHEYFSDGMTEDLITDLSKISGLFVISRNSVFSYKDLSVRA